MKYQDIKVKMIVGDDYEVVPLGEIKNVEIVNQAKRIFGPPAELRWEVGQCAVEQGDTVVEIGCCIGLFSLRAGLRGARKLIGFEPNHQNFECAKFNAAVGFYNHEKDARIINAAVCDHEGTAPFYDVQAVGQHGMFKYNRDVPARETKTTTLDSLWRKKMLSKIDFLKCDGNGSEHLIFAGLSDEHLLKIRKLSVQYHHQVTTDVPGWYDSFIARLKGLGFEVETGPVNSWHDDWIRAWRA